MNEDILQKLLINNQKLNNNFDNLLLLIANQQTQINNLTQVINMQSQLMNEVKMDLSRFLLKISDMEIRNNINDENIGEIINGINLLSDSNIEIKNAVDNIKVYQLPDNYFS